MPSPFMSERKPPTFSKAVFLTAKKLVLVENLWVGFGKELKMNLTKL